MMRFDPFREIEELAQRMDRSLGGQSQVSRFAPPVDVHEDDQGLEITLDLPGIPTDAIQIEAENQTLTVQAERRYERREGRTAHRVERSYGSYIRSFSVPAKYDLSAVSASHDNGILTLTVPRSEASQRRTIMVRSAEAHSRGSQKPAMQTVEAQSADQRALKSETQKSETQKPEQPKPEQNPRTSGERQKSVANS